jgi:hypothetical protein
MMGAPKNKALQMEVDYNRLLNWLKMNHLHCLFMTVNVLNKNKMLLYIDW